MGKICHSVAGDTAKLTIVVKLVIFTGSSRLCALLSQDMVLQGRSKSLVS